MFNFRIVFAKNLVVWLNCTSWCFLTETSRIQIPFSTTIELKKKKQQKINVMYAYCQTQPIIKRTPEPHFHLGQDNHGQNPTKPDLPSKTHTPSQLLNPCLSKKQQSEFMVKNIYVQACTCNWTLIKIKWKHNLI